MASETTALKAPESQAPAKSLERAPAWPRLTLKLRLSLIISALLALLTLAGGVYVVQKARSDVRDEVRSTLILTGHFLDAQLDVLKDHWAAGGYALPLFQLRELADVRHLNVRFYDTQGRILDSNEAPAGRQQRAPGWFATLVRATGSAMSGQTREVEFNGHAIGYLVLAPDPTYEIDEIWDTSRSLLQLLLLFFVLVNVFVWWAVSSALKPIDRIRHALDELRAGKVSTRLPRFTLPELYSIGVDFNHMAETLEKSLHENQRLTRAMLQTQETERRNLSHDLHDEIAQCVSAIHADAVAIRNRGDENVRESAEAIVAVTAQLKESVRGMLRRLRPAYLEGLGLEAGVREQVAMFRQRNPHIMCALRIEGDLGEVSNEVGVTIYRIIQESLTNIAMHAQARNALIEIVVEDLATLNSDVDVNSQSGTVRLVVNDDGAGFFQQSTDRGLGLTGIRERARMLGGSVDISSKIGHGTRIAVELPAVCDEGTDG